VFLAIIFSILIFFKKSHSEITLLLSTSASLYCSHAKPIREDFKKLQKQAKVTLPTGNNRTLPQRDKEKGSSKKTTKARLGLMPYISGFWFIQPRGPFFLGVISLTAQEKVHSKELKMN